MSDEPLAPAAGGATPCTEPPGVSLPPDALAAACMTRWLNAATLAASPDTQLFAKLIAARDVRSERALLGLSQAAWHGLLRRHFARAAEPATPHIAVSTGEHAEFVRTLHSLLLAHTAAAVHADDADCLAVIIAHACLRPDHLWRDLGLAGRDEVTWMLTRYFPTLVALNVANLRWKKFLAGQRALSLGLMPGPAPGCPGCEDYDHCFPDLR